MATKATKGGANKLPVKVSILQAQLEEANTVAKLLMDRITQIQEHNDKLITEINEERGKIRIPNKFNAYQYNELCTHLNKVRQQFVEALETSAPQVLDILEPATQDQEATSHVN